MSFSSSFDPTAPLGVLEAPVEAVGVLMSARQRAKAVESLRAAGHIEGNTYRYQITEEDEIWGARMCIGEGADETLEVLASMANRFVALGAQAHNNHGTRLDNLHDMFLIYSQPINQIWRRGGRNTPRGQALRRGCGDVASGKYCSEHRLARREKLSTASFADLRQMAGTPTVSASQSVDLTRAWCRGQASAADRVPGSVHFAIRSLVLDHVNDDASSPRIVLKGRNWFLAQPQTLGWPANMVSVRSGQGAVVTFVKEASLFAGSVAMGAAVFNGALRLIELINNRRV